MLLYVLWLEIAPLSTVDLVTPKTLSFPTPARFHTHLEYLRVLDANGLLVGMEQTRGLSSLHSILNL